LADSTISGNTASTGPGGTASAGGIAIAGGTALSNNSIISANTAGTSYSDITGTLSPSSGYNLIGTGGGLTNAVNGNIVGNDFPYLGALANYGGPTETLLPDPSSPAVDAGSNALIPTGVTTDQRGNPRIFGPSVDIGADEVRYITISGSVFDDLNQDGIKESNEPGLANQHIYLDSPGYSGDPYSPEATTDANGNYSFTRIPAATYNLDLVTTPGFTSVSPITGGLTVSPSTGQTLTGQNFALFTVSNSTPLTGPTICTPGSYHNGSTGIANATDNNLSTYFDGPTAIGNWVGVDLGSSGGVATTIAYASRSGWASRMNGGTFQASNSVTFSSGVVNLYTIPANANPSSTALTVQPITNTTAYRYYRYLSPAGSYGDVSEVQFFGTPGGLTNTTKLTGSVIGTAGSFNNQGNTAAKAFDGNLTTFFDAPTPSGSYTGLDLGSAQVVNQISYAPRSGWASRMVGGTFQTSNSATFTTSVVNLYTITTSPTTGLLTTISLSNTTAYRYYRYIGPANGYCDVAEIQFAQTQTSPGQPTVDVSGSTVTVTGTQGNDQISISYDISGTYGGIATAPVYSTIEIQQLGISEILTDTYVDQIDVNSLEGNDTITVNGFFSYPSAVVPGLDVSIVGGSGNDTVSVNPQVQFGNDYGLHADTVVRLGNGSDSITVTGDNNTIVAGNGNDVVSINPQEAAEVGLNATVTLGNGNNSLYTGPGVGIGATVNLNVGNGLDSIASLDGGYDVNFSVNGGPSLKVLFDNREYVGKLFVDANGDGFYQSSETPIANATVYIDEKGTGSYVSGDPVATTDANGN
jgi:hypothetical protein